MAGNRLHWSASIYQRKSGELVIFQPKIVPLFILNLVTGLLEGGALKHKDRPLWYDVYKAFPPKHEPTFARPAVEKEILPILYPEDMVRGKFAKLYGSPGYHDLMYPKSKSISQRFVEKYQELEKTGKFSNAQNLFDATEDYFIDEGLFEPRNEKNLNKTDESVQLKKESNVADPKPL